MTSTEYPIRIELPRGLAEDWTDRELWTRDDQPVYRRLAVEVPETTDDLGRTRGGYLLIRGGVKHVTVDEALELADEADYGADPHSGYSPGRRDSYRRFRDKVRAALAAAGAEAGR